MPARDDHVPCLAIIMCVLESALEINIGMSVLLELILAIYLVVFDWLGMTTFLVNCYSFVVGVHMLVYSCIRCGVVITSAMIECILGICVGNLFGGV